MSHTAALCGSLVRSSVNGGLPVMPALVVLRSSALAARRKPNSLRVRAPTWRKLKCKLVTEAFHASLMTIEDMNLCCAHFVQRKAAPAPRRPRQ